MPGVHGLITMRSPGEARCSKTEATISTLVCRMESRPHVFGIVTPAATTTRARRQILVGTVFVACPIRMSAESAARPINGMQGKVVVEFEVSPSGELTNFRIAKSQGEVLDQEAIRLIKEGPKWSPALRNDVPEIDKVRVKIKF